MRPIGVLGASGAVGAAAVDALKFLGLGPLRLGARRIELLPGDAEKVRVDVTDAVGVRDFVRGCSVVLDCTGPSYALGEAVPVASLAEGVPCVMVTGEQPVYDKLTPGPVPVVLSAGTLPGLSGLLPRLLAGPGDSLSVWTGGLERATPTVAADLVLSLDGNVFGEAGAAWRDGSRRSRTLTPAEDVEVSGFPGRVGVQPFLSLEAERVAWDLGLRALDWYHVHPGQAVRSVLSAAHLATGDLAGRILRAAEIDLAGRHPYYRMVFTTSARAALVRSPDSYRLTGAVGACAVRQIIDGKVGAGLHFADRALDPSQLLRDLLVADPSTHVEIADGGADDEEGAL